MRLLLVVETWTHGQGLTAYCICVISRQSGVKREDLLLVHDSAYCVMAPSFS